MALPATQKAQVVKVCGDVDALELVTDWPVPQRKDGEVIVKQSSTCVNPVDVYVRSGAYPPKAFPKCLGGDVAGEVVDAPEGSKIKKGDKVFALTFGYFNEIQEGSYCQYVAVPEADVALLPPNLPATQAGAVPLVALTAWQALDPFAPGQADGKRVLITAAAGGVGHVAVQLAKARGMYVVGTAGPDNQAYLKDIGCDEAINYREQDPTQLHKGAGKQFDIVVDCVGGPESMQAMTGIIKPGGYYSHIINRGTDQDKLNQLGEAAAQGQGPKVHVTLVKPNGEQLTEVAKLIGDGKVKMHIASTYPLEKAGEAHAEVAKWHTRGKVVISID